MYYFWYDGKLFTSMSWTLDDVRKCPFPARLWITISPADRSREMFDTIQARYKSHLMRFFRSKKAHGQSFAASDRRVKNPGIHDVLHSDIDIDPSELVEFFQDTDLRGANVWIQRYRGGESVYFYTSDPCKHEKFPAYVYCNGKGGCRYKRRLGAVRSCVFRRKML